MNVLPFEHGLQFDELLAFEEASEMRHEHRNGVLYPMVGGPIPHSIVGSNLMTAVGTRLRGKPCRGVGFCQRVRIGDDWYYPDLLIKCPPYRFHPRDANALLNPHAIFEVLSPATSEFDRTGKFDEYKAISEFSDYILVSADRVRVEHFRRGEDGEWTHRAYRLLTQELQLENFGISLPLAEIYQDIEVSEQGVLPGMEEG